MDLKFKNQFRRKLLTWYRQAKRDLPWRRTQDPYAIWVSEIMLQQTQVSTVIPYYRRFLQRFPNARSLAQANEEQVLALWSGLGYYRRCRLLQQGVRHVQEEFQGRIPDDPETLRGIPGIGPYTAGAIASIAFQRPAPLVDGNVIRVFARLFALKGNRKAPDLKKLVWEKAAELIDPKNPGDFNQALMELGATLCRTQLPACESCPVRSSCQAFALQRPEAFPEATPPDKTVKLHRMAALCRRGERILLVKRRASRWFQGMWELPHDYSDGRAGSSDLLAFLKHKFGIILKNLKALPATRHSITHHRIQTASWQGEASGKPRLDSEFTGGEFLKLADLADYPLPNLDRKVLKVAGLIVK